MAMQDTDIPFHAPPPALIVVDLPPPISVNEARRIDWRYVKKHKKWIDAADRLVMASRSRSLNPLPRKQMVGRFEITLIFNEDLTGNDLDNSVKVAIDYLKRIELIVDDAPKYMRRVVLEWGLAPTGTRVILRETT